MRYLILHVGAPTRYAAEGCPFIEVSATSAKLIGEADRLQSAKKIAFGYWTSDDCTLGSMTEHLVIVDTRAKKRFGDKVDKQHGWRELNVLTDKMCDEFNKRAEKIKDAEDDREYRREQREEKREEKRFLKEERRIARLEAKRAKELAVA